MTLRLYVIGQIERAESMNISRDRIGYGRRSHRLHHVKFKLCLNFKYELSNIKFIVCVFAMRLLVRNILFFHPFRLLSLQESWVDLNVGLISSYLKYRQPINVACFLVTTLLCLFFHIFIDCLLCYFSLAMMFK